jgi:hypothetical protein
MAEDLVSYDPGPGGDQLSRPEAEQLLAFYYVVGNPDAHANNVLLDRRAGAPGKVHLPIGIDHGLSLSKNVWYFRWPVDWIRAWEGPPLQSTVAFVAAIDGDALAQIAFRNHIDQEAVVKMLLRLERLKRDLSLFDMDSEAIGKSYDWEGYRNSNMFVRPHEAIGDANQGLDTETVQAIRKQVEALYFGSTPGTG